jgi:hypothetical protein
MLVPARKLACSSSFFGISGSRAYAPPPPAAAVPFVPKPSFTVFSAQALV